MVGKAGRELFASTVQPLLEDQSLKAGQHFDLVTIEDRVLDSEGFSGRLKAAAGSVNASVANFRSLFYGCKGRHCVSHFREKRDLLAHLKCCKRARWEINCELPLDLPDVNALLRLTGHGHQFSPSCVVHGHTHAALL